MKTQNFHNAKSMNEVDMKTTVETAPSTAADILIYSAITLDPDIKQWVDRHIEFGHTSKNAFVNSIVRDAMEKEEERNRNTA